MKTELLLAAGGAVVALLWSQKPASTTPSSLAPVPMPGTTLAPAIPSPSGTPPEITHTATGDFVPFWNGTGLQLGNGNMILPDGRVVTPEGALVIELREIDTTPWRPDLPQPPRPDPTLPLIKAGLKTVLNPRLIVKAADLAGFGSAPQAISQGVASGDVIASTTSLSGSTAAGSGLTLNVTVVGAVIGAAISIGFTLASEMPTNMMVVSIVLDVLNLALVFIPVVGWALALIASFFKSSIVKLFAPDLTHEQRELLELKHVLERTEGLYKYWVRRAITPTMLYEGIALYNTGTTSHEATGGVAISLRYLSVDGRVKTIRPTNATPRADGMVLHAGRWVTPGTPQDFVTSVALIPEGFFIRIQAGINPEMLAPAEDYHAMQVQRRCKLIVEAQHASGEALMVLTHVWHIMRDPVVNVRRWLDGSVISPEYGPIVRPWETTVHTEVPMLEEVLLSLYYNDLAIYWNMTSLRNGATVGDWQKLVGVVIQPLWTEYHAHAVHNGATPTLGGFLSWLGESSIMSLREHVFAGRYPVEGTEGVPMFEQITNDLKVLEANLDITWRQACLAQPLANANPNFQGLYRNGKPPTDAEILANYNRMGGTTSGVTSSGTTLVLPSGEVVTGSVDYVRAVAINAGLVPTPSGGFVTQQEATQQGIVYNPYGDL